MPNAVSARKREFLVDARCITFRNPAGIVIFSKKRIETPDTLTLKSSRSFARVRNAIREADDQRGRDPGSPAECVGKFSIRRMGLR
jgi:hypothetical protein